MAVGVLFLPLFYFANDLYIYLSSPLRAYLPEGTSMIATFNVDFPLENPHSLTHPIFPRLSNTWIAWTRDFISIKETTRWSLKLDWLRESSTTVLT